MKKSNNPFLASRTNHTQNLRSLAGNLRFFSAEKMHAACDGAERARTRSNEGRKGDERSKQQKKERNTFELARKKTAKLARKR